MRALPLFMVTNMQQNPRKAVERFTELEVFGGGPFQGASKLYRDLADDKDVADATKR
ncbi:hypothetical protein GGTG_13433 [Gaeumannomyces tritici R3-111a-1]|uniref:Uncharacterized protein n=1 Tax=Gaeumannomyces tritici (strain R3-111a-1) TaxID=644352 RepID=J3PIV3_GAET3|nr:hypothetical protein GGTG_13433 [Gaeumannomyces tritici R3-111a-1]EJT69036.1 hypothetical protein GGTG_13433 [Gaeumannomyces tritici R3-111a-1]